MIPARVPEIPIAPPRAEFVWEAVVEIAPTPMLGEGPMGTRRMVPIAGGADCQPVRRDGVRRLEALYELQTEDGAVITVHNHVVIAPREGGRPDDRFFTIEVTAPEGR